MVSRTTPDCDGDQVDYQVDCDDLDALIGGDLDGDPVVCGADCDMTEPARYPGNREVCDGLDNDCDPATAPPPRLCAVVATDVEGNVVQCSVGERTCDDTVADAAYGACDHQMTLPAADYELCASWVGCADSPDPTCVADRGLRCKLPLAAAGEACTPSIAKLADLVPDANAVCNWRLIGNIQQGSRDVGLRPRGTTGPLVSLVPTCDAELVVDQAPGGPAPRIFILTYEDGNGEVQILSVLIDPVRKDCDPAAPSTLECEEVAP